MSELIALADKSGWFIVIVLFVAWRFVPVMADKLAPEWMAARREESAAKRAGQDKIVDKVISVVESNTRFASAVAASMNNLERAIDANTQQLSRMTEIVRRGPECPLPSCPWMNKESSGT